MEERDYQEGKMTTSTESSLIYQIVDEQQEESSSHDSSGNNRSETHSSTVFPLVPAHPIDPAAPSSGNIEYEHRANAIPLVAEQSVDLINSIVPGVSKESTSEAASAKALKQLQARCKKLEEELAKKERDLKAARYNVTAARAETTKLKTYQEEELKKQRNELLEKHRKEVETLKKKAAEDAEEYKKLTARVKKLTKSSEKVPLLIKSMKHVEGEMKLQGMEIECLKDRCATLYGMYADKTLEGESWKESYDNLKEDMRELKEKHELELRKQKPLLLVSVAIRQRFLEQARSLLPPYVSPTDDEDICEIWGDGDKTIINLGNAAAHSGNLDADAALFTCGFVDEEKEVGNDICLNYGELFEAIYQLKPQPSSKYAPYLRRMRNLEATILTTNLNDEIYGPAAARWEVLKRLEKLARRVRMEEDAYGNEPSRHLDEQLREARQATSDFVETFRRR
jgi:hypothetical protein